MCFDRLTDNGTKHCSPTLIIGVTGSLGRAMEEVEIVYINLASDLDVMGQNIIRAMQKYGVKRVVEISSIGIYAENPQNLRPVLQTHRALADRTEQSGLYTIVRANWFTYGDEIDYGITVYSDPEKGGALPIFLKILNYTKIKM